MPEPSGHMDGFTYAPRGSVNRSTHDESRCTPALPSIASFSFPRLTTRQTGSSSRSTHPRINTALAVHYAATTVSKSNGIFSLFYAQRVKRAGDERRVEMMEEEKGKAEEEWRRRRRAGRMVIRCQSCLIRPHILVHTLGYRMHGLLFTSSMSSLYYLLKSMFICIHSAYV